MDEQEQRHAAYLEQVRAKYDAAQLKALKAKGHTLPGTTSYPIDDAEDLDNAIHAVGRGNADHDKIRAYIIGRAKAMGLSSKIPDDWNSDGSLKASNSADPDGEERDQPTPEDFGVMSALKDANLAISHAKAKQLADPDYKTDPDDQAVMDAIKDAGKAIDKAIVAQSKDGHDDKPGRSANWATAKRAFSSLVEHAPARATELQIRMDPAEGSSIANFRGYAYTIDERYGVTDWMGEYKERVGPGASSKTLREQTQIPLLVNHGGIPLANTMSRTSELSDDGHGLLNGALLDRRQGITNDVCIGMERGDIRFMSFSFRAITEDWNETYDDRYVRELQLFDTSIVTYPANPATSAELVEAMRSAMGREGRSLWLADSEMSVRSMMPNLRAIASAPGMFELDPAEGDLVERAVRALAHADEVVCRSAQTAHGRARTFQVAHSLMDLRAGKVLSAANQALLQTAADALAAADDHRNAMAGHHETAIGALGDALASQQGADGSGEDNGTPPQNGNPAMPMDGAGPRSLPPSVVQARQAVERLKRGR